MNADVACSSWRRPGVLVELRMGSLGWGMNLHGAKNVLWGKIARLANG